MKTITFNKDGLEIPIRFVEEKNTIWMTQNEMATLFSTSRVNITKHIRLLSDYFNKNPSTRNSELLVAQDGKRRKMSVYNLDVIRLIGFKIDPVFTNNFISWCNEQLNGGNNQLIPIGSNIIRFDNGDVSLDVTVEPLEDTVYLSKDQLVLLFDTTRQNIDYHLTNIYNSGELELTPTCKEILQVQTEGDREVSRINTFYNLDVIISLGFRINNKKGIEFRRWANTVLKEYLIKGYVINDKRSLVTNENYINLVHKVNSIDYRLSKVEKEKNIALPEHKLLYDGKVLDAFLFVKGLVESANKTLVVIDPWTDAITLSLLDYKKDDVELILITSNKHRITKESLNRFPRLNNTLFDIDDTYHSRFIIIDDSIYYDLGQSINYIGNRLGTVNRIDKYIQTIEAIKNKIKNKDSMSYINEIIK